MNYKGKRLRCCPRGDVAALSDSTYIWPLWSVTEARSVSAVGGTPGSVRSAVVS